MADADEMTSVYEAMNSAEAFVVRGALAEHGIEAFVSEPNQPFVGLALAMPQVLVRAGEAESARQVIAALEQAGDDQSAGEEKSPNDAAEAVDNDEIR